MLVSVDKFTRAFFLLVFVASLSACGGGSRSDEPGDAEPEVYSIGAGGV